MDIHNGRSAWKQTLLLHGRSSVKNCRQHSRDQHSSHSCMLRRETGRRVRTGPGLVPANGRPSGTHVTGDPNTGESLVPHVRYQREVRSAKRGKRVWMARPEKPPYISRHAGDLAAGDLGQQNKHQLDHSRTSTGYSLCPAIHALHSCVKWLNPTHTVIPVKHPGPLSRPGDDVTVEPHLIYSQRPAILSDNHPNSQVVSAYGYCYNTACA